MTLDEKKAIFAQVQERALNALREAAKEDVSDAKITQLMRTIRDCKYTSVYLIQDDDFSMDEPEPTPDTPETPKEDIPDSPAPDTTKNEPAPACEEAALSADKPDTEVAPDEDPVPPQYTKDQVRKLLREYQTRDGVNVGKIIEDLGFANLSAIPPERYGEVLQLAESQAQGV